LARLAIDPGVITTVCQFVSTAIVLDWRVGTEDCRHTYIKFVSPEPPLLLSNATPIPLVMFGVVPRAPLKPHQNFIVVVAPSLNVHAICHPVRVCISEIGKLWEELTVPPQLEMEKVFNR